MLLLAAAPKTVCLAGGFCAAAVRLGPPSGLMFLALGFVALGGAGLLGDWRRRRQRGLSRSGRPDRAG